MAQTQFKNPHWVCTSLVELECEPCTMETYWLDCQPCKLKAGPAALKYESICSLEQCKQLCLKCNVALSLLSRLNCINTQPTWFLLAFKCYDSLGHQVIQGFAEPFAQPGVAPCQISVNHRSNRTASILRSHLVAFSAR